MNTYTKYPMGEARARLTEIVTKALKDGPVVLTKLNLPVIVMMSVEDYEKLINNER